MAKKPHRRRASQRRVHFVISDLNPFSLALGADLYERLRAQAPGLPITVAPRLGKSSWMHHEEDFS